MKNLRIRSITDPLLADSRAAVAGARLLARAQYLGALAFTDEPQDLNRQLLLRVFAGLSELGLARDASLHFEAAGDAQKIRQILETVLEQTDHAPVPSGEWKPLTEALGEALLADLLGVSASSLRRYLSGTRPTPQDVAERLHFLALLVADLSGAYNEYGIRRWFSRKRATLGGQPPASLLGAGFDPDGADARRLRGLAGSLTAAGAT